MKFNDDGRELLVVFWHMIATTARSRCRKANYHDILKNPRRERKRCLYLNRTFDSDPITSAAVFSQVVRGAVIHYPRNSFVYCLGYSRACSIWMLFLNCIFGFRLQVFVNKNGTSASFLAVDIVVKKEQDRTVNPAV